MGKPTQGQLKERATPPKDRVVREGVTLRYSDDRPDLELDGDYEAQLTPNGAVCFIEMIPDLLNQNKGQPAPIVRRFVNAKAWAEVTLR